MSEQVHLVAQLSAILRIINSCGGAQAADESDDHHTGYNAALDAVEREMKRAWPRISELPPVPATSEPTQAMIEAGNAMFHRGETALNIWRAMQRVSTASGPMIGEDERGRCMNIVHNHYDVGRDELVALLKGDA